MSEVSLTIDDVVNDSTAEELLSIVSLGVHVGDINSRYRQITEAFGDDSDIIEILQEDLHTEQAETMESITAQAEVLDPVFQELGMLSCLTLQESLEAAQQVEDLEDARAQKLEEYEQKRADYLNDHQPEIDRVVEATQRISPRSTARIKALLEQRILALDQSEDLQSLEGELARLADEIALSKKLHGQLVNNAASIGKYILSVGEAWALPLILRGEIDLLSQKDQEELIVDVLPDDDARGEHDTDEKPPRMEHIVDEPRATAIIIRYFNDNIDKVITVDELIRNVYDDEAVARSSARHLRSRITTILGANYTIDVGATLRDDSDLVLQRGYRTYLREADGRYVVDKKHRIYRVLKSNDERLVVGTKSQTEEYTDEFEPANGSDLKTEKVRPGPRRDFTATTGDGVAYLGSNVYHQDIPEKIEQRNKEISRKIISVLEPIERQIFEMYPSLNSTLEAVLLQSVVTNITRNHLEKVFGAEANDEEFELTIQQAFLAAVLSDGEVCKLHKKSSRIREVIERVIDNRIGELFATAE